MIRRGDSWRLYADAGRDPVTGKRRQRTMTLAPVNGKAVGKREAQDRLREFIAEVTTDTRTDRSQATLRELFDGYLELRSMKSAGALKESRRRFDAYVPEHLARTPIGKITTYTLDQLYVRLLASGGRCRRRKEKCPPELYPCKHGGGDALTPRTVDTLHTDLAAAFRQAVRWGWVRASPAEHTMSLEGDRHEVVPPSVADVLRFLTHLEGLGPEQSTLRDFVPLLVATGARAGEVSALKIGDVDFELGRVTIRRAFTAGNGGSVKDTKTHKVRTLRLDRAILDRLTERRQRLTVDALAAGVPIEEWWWFPSPVDPMRPVWPGSVSREMREQRDALEISTALTLRNLRHWVASVLLAAGSITDGEVQSADVRTTAGRLGHGANMTLGVYGHLINDADATAAEVVSLVLERERRKAATS